MPERTLKDFVAVLFRHKRKILAVFGIVMGLIVLVTFLSPRIYQSDARLLLRLGRENVSLDPTASTGQVVSITQSRESQINSELEILKSREVAEQTVDLIGAERVLRGSDTELPPAEASAAEAGLLREKAVGELRHSLRLEVLKDSNVIVASYEARSPEVAQAVVSTMIDTYLDRHIDAHRTKGAYGFFRQETDQLREQLAETEAQLKDLKNQTNIGSLDEQRRLLMNRIAILEQDQHQTNAALSGSRARARSLKETLQELPEQIVTQETSGLPDSAADAMRAKLYELQLREQDLLSRYRENSQPIKEVRRQIAEAEALLKKGERRPVQVTTGLSAAHQQVKSDLLTEEASMAALAAKARALSREIKAARDDLKQLNESELQMAQLERQLATQKSNYEKYTTSLEQARIDEALETERISNVSIIQPASFVSTPVRPRTTLNLTLGFLIAALCGVGFAFASDYLDHRIRTERDVDERLGLRTLAGIPHWDEAGDEAAPLRERRLKEILPDPYEFAQEEPQGADLLPSRFPEDNPHLWDQLVATEKVSIPSPGILAVAGCRGGEGVSSVAASIAVGLRRESGGRVLLIDMGAIRRSTQDGLFTLPASAVTSWGGELSDVHHSYTWKTKSELMSQLRQERSAVVLDVPPILSTKGAVRLCSIADGVVLVVEAEATRWQVAQEAKKRLGYAKANILGIVLNKRRYPIPDWVYRRL